MNKRMIDLNERNPFKPGPRWRSKDKHKKILATLRTPTLQAQDNANAQIVFCGHSLSSQHTFNRIGSKSYANTNRLCPHLKQQRHEHRAYDSRFSHDVTAAMFVPLNKETAAKFVSPTQSSGN